jgi:hypothetical protein
VVWPDGIYAGVANGLESWLGTVRLKAAPAGFMADERSHQVGFEQVESRDRTFAIKYWPWVLVVVLALGWAVEHRQVQSERSSFYLKEVTVTVVDADTRKPLTEYSIKYPAQDRDGRWPHTVMKTLSFPPSFRLLIGAVAPAQYGIGSEGYETKQITITRESDTDITVPLKRLSGESPATEP